MCAPRIFVVAGLSLILLVIVPLDASGVEIKLNFAKLVTPQAVLVFASALAGLVPGLVGCARLARRS